MRRAKLAIVLLLAVGSCSPAYFAVPTALDAEQQVEDFDAMWQTLRREYAAFGSKKTDWTCVRETFRPLARTAPSREAFVHVLEPALASLYDGHTHLNMGLADSWWADPWSVYGEWRGDRAIVVDLRGDAVHSGLAPGMEVVAIDGAPIGDIVARRYPRCLTGDDPEARTWALLSALAGQMKRERRVIEAKDATGAVRRFEFKEAHFSDTPLVTSRVLPGGIGYVRINSVGNSEAVPAFDAALEQVRDTVGLLLDVRDIPGGNTSVTRPMLGRLLHDRRQYCWMAERRGPGLGPRWPEFVDPRGPWTYEKPVVALVNHWTMSAAEGFAVALESMHRGLAVGTRMRGLDAGVLTLSLQSSDVRLNYSAEPVYQMNGQPRNNDQPAVLVDLASLTSAEDPILAAGLRELTERSSPRWATIDR